MWSNYGGNFGGGAVFAFATWLVVFIDLILLGVFLWKQINKTK